MTELDVRGLGTAAHTRLLTGPDRARAELTLFCRDPSAYFARHRDYCGGRERRFLRGKTTATSRHLWLAWRVILQQQRARHCFEATYIGAAAENERLAACELQNSTVLQFIACWHMFGASQGACLLLAQYLLPWKPKYGGDAHPTFEEVMSEGTGDVYLVKTMELRHNRMVSIVSSGSGEELQIQRNKELEIPGAASPALATPSLKLPQGKGEYKTNKPERPKGVSPGQAEEQAPERCRRKDKQTKKVRIRFLFSQVRHFIAAASGQRKKKRHDKVQIMEPRPQL